MCALDTSISLSNMSDLENTRLKNMDLETDMALLPAD